MQQAYTTQKDGDPPFDGSLPCPACPVEVRDLSACVTNFLNEWDRSGMCADDRLSKKLVQMRRSAAQMRTICDDHFADSMHSLGKLPRHG